MKVNNKYLDRKRQSDWWNEKISSTWVAAMLAVALLIGGAVVVYSYNDFKAKTTYVPIRDITRDVTTGQGTPARPEIAPSVPKEPRIDD